MPQRPHDVVGGEGPEAGEVQQTDLDALVVAHPVDSRFGGLHHAAGTDDGVLGIVEAVWHHRRIVTACELAELFHDFLQRRQHLIVIAALGDLALHVAVLVLHHAGHQRNLRIHQVAQARRRADEHLHHVGLEQPHVFNGVGGQEPVLNVEERRLGVLGHAAGDQRHVSCLLRVAGVEDAPTAIGNANDVVMPGMDVEPLGSQGAGPDVEHDGQALAGDHVQDLLHEDQALARGEVGDSAPRHCEPFASGGGAVLRLRLDEGEFLAP